jgi:hypothetical protein
MGQSDDRYSVQSEESVLEMEGNSDFQNNKYNQHHHHHYPYMGPTSSSLQPVASGGQLSESSAAYFSWPTSNLLPGAAEGRANYFGNLQKGVLPVNLGRLPKGQQVITIVIIISITHCIVFSMCICILGYQI